MNSNNFFWGDIHETEFDPLQNKIEAKYLIIGGGISGLSAAHFLLEQGETDIVLIDRGAIGSGSTGRSAGMFVCEPETASWAELVACYGSNLSKQYWDAQTSALRVISEIVENEGIQCDLMSQELLLLAGTPSAQAHILGDFFARRAMNNNAELLSGDALAEEFTTDKYFFGERVKENISVNPLLLARGLARYLVKRGVRIYENTPMVSVGQGYTQTQSGGISHAYVVQCLGTKDKNPKIETYLTTISITRKLTETELKKIGLADRDMFLDDERRSYHYGKITEDARLLVGYGDVKAEGVYGDDYVHEAHRKNIERFLKRVFPDIDMSIERSWSAEYALSSTELPFVAITENEAIINGAGTQLASIVAASYAMNKLLGKQHPLDELFSSAR